MSTNVSVRNFKTEDLDRIVEITEDAWEPVYNEYRDIMGEKLFLAKYGNWREHKTSQVKRQCQRDPTLVRIACIDGNVVGYATFSIDTDAGIGEIGNNAVDPSSQGQGVATELYRAILKEFKDHDLEFAEVSTGLTESFAAARQVYEKVGFNIERPVITYWQQL